MSRCWNTPNLAWKRCGKSKWWISLRLSSWMTKGTISSSSSNRAAGTGTELFNLQRRNHFLHAIGIQGQADGFADVVVGGNGARKGNFSGGGADGNALG